MQHLGGDQQRLEQLVDISQSVTGAGQGAADPTGGHRRAVHVGQQHRGALDRYVLEHQQVHRQRAQVRPVDHRRARLWRRGRRGHRAARTASLVHPVLSGRRGDLRDVHDLAHHHARLGRSDQILPAPATRLRQMVDHHVRIRATAQVRTRRTRLLTRRATRPR